MRWRPLTWLFLSVMFFAAAYYFWRLGDQWAAKRASAPRSQHVTPTTQHSTRTTHSSPIHLLSQSGNLNFPPLGPSTNQPAARNTNRFALRLSNTSIPIGQLQRSDTAILLENALLDTARPATLPIPGHLRAQGDPGSYVVQARGPIDASFRSLLKAAEATVVSYIPNNAYLVRASGAVAQQLQADPRTQTVLPYEPYYKLKPSLLKLAVRQEPLPDQTMLNVLLFADAREQTLTDMANHGVQVLGESQSPFGPVVGVLPPVDSLPFLAGLPGVQGIETALMRSPANDLSRVRIGVSTDTVGPTGYLGLTGTNVLVNVNDSGVDAAQRDLTPRVVAANPAALVDTNGHGTHVAGIIASSGASSLGPPSVGAAASGSVSNASFRGKAPGARLFVQPVEMMTRPLADGATLRWPSDADLQQGAARTNAFISNNGWNYVGTDSQTYDLHAASYDAAVRDALPAVTGSQPVLFVFSAGNSGGGDNSGGLGQPNTVETPATAKNVITVGAIEQLRRITNEVSKCSVVNGTNSCATNVPWRSMTDSTNEVAAFSSRGNVGVGVEGEFGRFKPDVVAPGTFVVSTRSGQWDTNAYYNPTGQLYFAFPDVIVAANQLRYDSIFVPDNAVQVNLTVVPNNNSPVPFPDLPIFVKQTDFPTNSPGGYDFVGTNHVSWPPDFPLSPVGTYWYYAVGNYTTQAVAFDLITTIIVTNELGNYLQVLAGMNDALGRYYRYESGTSMAAADASGTLALMQEFFESRLSLTNHSPALMKALLINGARTVGGNYDFNVRGPVNYQGWGLLNLPTSLPGSLSNLTAATKSIFVFDQNATNALATGQSHTRYLSLSRAAQNQPLRVTLVWTDPPGNPVASVKLVNNLDLIVTNLDTSEVFYGNDILLGSDFNLPLDTNSIALVDTINNVENVYLSPALTVQARLSTNYSITVLGHRVNVNAVTANPDNVAQDYALVVSSGDAQPANALTLTDSPIVYETQPLVTVVSNTFASSPGFAGGFLLNQRVGANTPLLGTNSVLLPTEANGVLTLGMTNQWHFYAITNNTSFTNAAFLTFLPPNLAVPRMGVFEPSAELATRPEADIDLFVAPPTIANNYALTNLVPAVIDATTKSLSRGGTETVVYSNATPGVYYFGVKSEDQQAAEYAILAVFSERPFGGTDTNGNQHLIGFPTPMPIPDGSPESSRAALMLAVSPQPIKLHRVIVTNIINHELMTDLVGSLSHGGEFAVLNSHTCVTAPATSACETWTSYIYDDSAEGNVVPFPFLINPQVQRTDGPGTLNDFAGKDGAGQWQLTMVDNATNHVGTNVMLGLFLELQQDMASSLGITALILGGACRDDFVDVPPDAVSMTVEVSIISATPPIHLTLQVCPADGGACKNILVTNTLGGSITIDQTDLPPLQAGGSYVVRTCNLSTTPITVNLRASFSLSLNTITPVVSLRTTVPVPILDDAVTEIHLTNNLHRIISSLDVGLLIDDPRVSDLAITLVSPNGTRVLLFENRGALTTNGLGIGTFGLAVVTNMAPVYTNDFNAAPVGLYAPGAMFQGWGVLSNLVDVLDDYTCFCLSNHMLALFDGGVSNSLPTTNAISIPNPNPYTLSYRVNHLPWLEGMVTWWPLDMDGSDIFGGLNGLLLGNVAFSAGEVNQAFFGDGLATRMIVPACPELDLGRGRGFSIEGWINPASVANPGPLVEWYDPIPPTNQSPLGVQFWLALTNGPGSLGAAIWDTNSQPHVITTPAGVITNTGWQHVALTYDTNSGLAALYVNGLTNNQPLLATNLGRFVPRTTGDLYVGYDPTIIPTPINYPNFSSTTGLNLVGDAAVVGGTLRLTPAAEVMIGDVWAQAKQPCASGFNTSFEFRISNQGGRPGITPGGDGILFTVQNLAPDLLNGTLIASNHFSVFFNTAWNWPGCTDYATCDVSDNSAGILSNNLYVAQMDLTPIGINLNDGAVHQSRIAFDGTGLSVWLDGVRLFTNVAIPGMAQAVDAAGKAWVGFGAGTGWAWETHEILSWTFSGPTPGTAFAGGLDEFSVYERALSPCEVSAIFNAGRDGKYGTNVLVCPVATEVSLQTASGLQTYAFTNGLNWISTGPQWETNTLYFSTSTNPTAIVVRGLNPYNSADPNAPNNLNAVVDDFVLSTLVTNSIDGLLHFTENTNLAALPIKFASAPYAASNFPPILIFSNDFNSALSGLYSVSNTIPGSPNSPNIGTRDWTVTQGSVTVLSNALFDTAKANSLALATGAVQCLLPTTPGHRYQLSYNLRGPCAVGWWNGSVDPLSQRARDLISGNNGAFLNGAASVAPGFVGAQALTFFDDPAGKVELADPPQLQFTNAFTIEAWIKPLAASNVTHCGTEQIFFRGYPEPLDCGGLGDPYWLALEPSTNSTSFDVHFHIADAHVGTLGADVRTTNAPIQIGGGATGAWWHVAAVFDKPFTYVAAPSGGTNLVTVTTNALRLYLNGVCVATNYTALSPYQDLDPALSPGVTIGNRSRYDWTQPFNGLMDELTVYARALTGPEIAAIAAAGSNGKAAFSLPPPQSLAALEVGVDSRSLGVVYGYNEQWTTHTVEFTAFRTNAVLTLQSLLPGTLVGGIALSEVPSELFYLPEVSLSDLYGQDAFGIWTLEIQDNRTGLVATNPQLLDWQLNFGLAPINPPPVISLSHGITYTNSLAAYGVQYFTVPVPQWATLATNTLEFAVQAHTTTPLPVTVLFNQTNYPSSADLALIGPLASSGTSVLSTNTTPPLVIGQMYFLAVTNPNPVATTFGLGVEFDVTTLANCQMTPNVVGLAGIPRYFQFDVTAATPQQVAVWLSGANSNLTVVLSEHLPLPDLNHYDYISEQPSTNAEIVMVLTNSTPFAIQTNRWYAGVFNTTAANVPFAIQACVKPVYPALIPLTNGVPFVVPLPGSPFAAPPGPPQQFFFDFFVSNSVPGILFELYNLSGDADLVLQREVPPGMAPYFDGSFFVGPIPEQIVVRTSAEVPDLRGHWYLGVYNNETVNVAYTIRAVLPCTNGLLVSAQPLTLASTPLNPPHGLLLSWNSVEGEPYFVQYTASVTPPVVWNNIGFIVATTPLTTFEVLPVPSTPAFYRIVQTSSALPKLTIQLWPGNQVRLSWSTAYSGFTLQSKLGLFGTWASAGLPENVVGSEYVAFETIGPAPKFYRLFK